MKTLKLYDRVKTNTGFSGVPKGTIGIVKKLYESFDKKYRDKGIKSALIEWQLDRKFSDGFAPDEFHFLELLTKIEK